MQPTGLPVGVSIPSRGSSKGDQIGQSFFTVRIKNEFQSPLGEVVKETGLIYTRWLLLTVEFQSPLGEVVKETPDRDNPGQTTDKMFQSPLGEVVKETKAKNQTSTIRLKVSIPSRGSSKGDALKKARIRLSTWKSFNPLSGK